MKSVVIPLEAEIARLKTTLTSTEQRLQKYEPEFQVCIVCHVYMCMYMIVGRNHRNELCVFGIFANISVYCTSKAAVANLTRSMAMELAPDETLVGAFGLLDYY